MIKPYRFMILLYNFWTYPILHIQKVSISSWANLQHLSVLNLAGSQLANLIYFLDVKVHWKSVSLNRDGKIKCWKSQYIKCWKPQYVKCWKSQYNCCFSERKLPKLDSFPDNKDLWIDIDHTSIQHFHISRCLIHVDLKVFAHWDLLICFQIATHGGLKYFRFVSWC